MRRLTLKQLQTVRAVAQCGTIATAADMLKVTPAALTARIKLLEGDVGLAFFDRAGGRLRLTDAGQEVVNTTVRMEMLLVELGNTLAALKGKHAGRISVGLVSTAKYFAPRLIAAFSHENPRIDLALAIGNRQETIRQLRDYGIDIALMGQPPSDFPVVSQVIGEHAQVVIAPLDHKLVGRRLIPKAELALENFIVREDGSGTRTVFDFFFDGVTVRRPPPPSHQVRDRLERDDQAGGHGRARLEPHLGPHDRRGARRRPRRRARRGGPSAHAQMVPGTACELDPDTGRQRDLGLRQRARGGIHAGLRRAARPCAVIV